MSEFSTFGPRTASGLGDSRLGQSAASNFSSFGKPILPASGRAEAVSEQPVEIPNGGSDTFAGQSRISLGKASVMLVFGAVVAITLLALLYPFDRFRGALESTLSESFCVSVSIGKVDLGFLPSPYLSLTGIKLAGGAAGSIEQVRIASPWSLLGSSPYRISRIDVIAPEISAVTLVGMPVWRGLGLGAVVTERAHIERLRVRLNETLALPLLYGELRFRGDGLIDKASFENEDRGLLVEAIPSAQGIGLSIEGRAWKMDGMDIAFASLQAKGLLQSRRLVIHNIDTTFMGGILRGNWQIDWGDTPTMTAEGNLSRIDLRKVSAAFFPTLKMEGDLSGPIRLRSGGSGWDSLWRDADVAINAEITRGVLIGVDLGEASRRDGGTEVRGGATRFDRLRAAVSVARGQVVGRELRMDAGMMTASGQFTAGQGGYIDANLAVSLQTSVSSVSIPVRVSGKLPDLVAIARK